jgi:hypothetical protein
VTIFVITFDFGWRRTLAELSEDKIRGLPWFGDDPPRREQVLSGL